MRIFNLAEELEKERKKNKELQEEANKYVCYYRYVKNEKEELQALINKAINILEKRINIIEKQEWKSYTGQTDEEYLQEQKEILDILKGE